MTDMKELLKQMFQGWILHENSWDSESHRYTRTAEDCMTEACGGDELKGQLLYLFGHWSNDIQCIAPFYGLALEHRPNSGPLYIKEDVPPAPSPHHYWHNGEWVYTSNEHSKAKEEVK